MASFPSVRTPGVDELVAIAAEFGIRLTPALASSYRELIAEGIESYTRIDALPEPGLPVAYPRTPGHRPPPEENPPQRLVLALRSKAAHATGYSRARPSR